ncbi:MAG: aldo/keto reductase [Bacteroidia bacterium]|nr:aldo/keto reductase [Bacteroidia bacterium]
MNDLNNSQNSRRQFLKKSALLAVGTTLVPTFLASGALTHPAPLMKRTFGRIGFKVTTLGLGGQAALQWTPENTDPVAIIEKAYNLGINYFDTSNAYGPSQMNYGKAFTRLGLVPGTKNYNFSKRKAIFLTTKTMLRFGKGGDNSPVAGYSNGAAGSKALDDVRRSLSQIFGDGSGSYPKEAWLDMVLIHNLNKMEEVDALYEGYDNRDPKAPTIGALAALRDVRDGSNHTGLNPKNEKLIRHIGFSGHNDTAVMMEMIQRDSQDLLDGMLVAINANDQLYFNMQHNVIPIAAAKKMGIIAMKVFADGAMYSKKAEWSNKVSHVVLEVGSKELPADQLIKYSLSTPGIHTAIIGIGKINEDPAQCQLTFNLKHAQVKPEEMPEKQRKSIELLALKVKDGKTNYFQKTYQELTPPRETKVTRNANGAQITWHTAFAGDSAIDRYEIWRNGAFVEEIPFKPQISKTPYHYEDKHSAAATASYVVKVVDKKNREAEARV